jgi:hypothetical protein
MNIEQTRGNLKRLVDKQSVIEAYLSFGGYGGQYRAFIKLIIEPPYSAEREEALTLAAQEATGSHSIPVIIEYATGESSDGQRS